MPKEIETIASPSSSWCSFFSFNIAILMLASTRLLLRSHTFDTNSGTDGYIMIMQKTLGHHTQCSKCQLLQGQFCGNCLFARYGENILETSKNPNWICPVCRGICNCSLCRIKKGLVPTGILYKKVVNLGYKSVAHYLIQTQQQQQTISCDLNPSKSISAEDSSCVHNDEHDPNNDPEENKSNPENGKITKENYSSIEAGVISSDDNSAKNAVAKKANKSLEDVNPAIKDTIASRLRKRNIP